MSTKKKKNVADTDADATDDVVDDAVDADTDADAKTAAPATKSKYADPTDATWTHPDVAPKHGKKHAHVADPDADAE